MPLTSIEKACHSFPLLVTALLPAYCEVISRNKSSSFLDLLDFEKQLDDNH